MMKTFTVYLFRDPDCIRGWLAYVNYEHARYATLHVTVEAETGAKAKNKAITAANNGFKGVEIIQRNYTDKYCPKCTEQYKAETQKRTVLMPKELTEKNGAKKALIGEFCESAIIGCPECDGWGCMVCSGYGELSVPVPVSWTTIKNIYKAAVKFLGKEIAPPCVDSE